MIGLNSKLKKQIEIKNSYLDLIYMIGCDYDGCNNAEDLKELIDELIDLAIKGKYNDTNSVIFMDNLNILGEEIKNRR